MQRTIVSGRVQPGYHHHGNALERSVRLQVSEYFIAIHHGHHHIQQHQVGHFFCDGLECLFAIGGLARPESQQVYVVCEYLPIRGSVVYNQHQWNMRRIHSVSLSTSYLRDS